MGTAQIDSVLAKKLSTFIVLSPGELKCLADMQSAPLKVKQGKQLTQEGQTGHRAFVLQTGWASSYKDLPNGRRQIISFPIPGDCVGLRSVLLRTADHSAVTVTDAMVAEVPAQRMLTTFHLVPRLGAAILWAASRDEAMVVEHLVGIGRRDALTRTAHFLVELGLRLSLIGLGSEKGYTCPLNQYVLADALGLTAIHLNRTLRQLRERKLMTFRDGEVTFHDLRCLRMLAGHHGGYLDQGNAPT